MSRGTPRGFGRPRPTEPGPMPEPKADQLRFLEAIRLQIAAYGYHGYLSHNQTRGVVIVIREKRENGSFNSKWGAIYVPEDELPKFYKDYRKVGINRLIREYNPAAETVIALHYHPSGDVKTYRVGSNPPPSEAYEEFRGRFSEFEIPIEELENYLKTNDE